MAIPGCAGAGLSFDEDHDGLSTTCEEALAAAFAPELLADPADCLWDGAGDLSAHCFGRSDGRCRWFRKSDLADFAWSDDRPGAPLVWVARDKHANYPSRASCESGH